MNWISFVCLLAFSTTACGYSLGRYSQPAVPKIPIRSTLPSGTRYQSLLQASKSGRLALDFPELAAFPLAEAISFCGGQIPNLLAILENNETLVICNLDRLDDEFFCPDGLVYRVETKRCEYKFSVNENVCATQPCLNGGRCIPTQYSYECDCSQGFSGRTCELDATVCQQQQPCGSSLDAVCQSFPVGAPLKHVCIFENGRAYGLTGSQVFPNPCLTGEGFHPLAFGNKGFIMCDAERMFIQSCSGGTVWDSLARACSWPNMEETVPSVGSVEVPAQRFVRMASSESGGFSASLSSDDDFDGPLIRGMSTDDSASSSIRIPFRPSSSGNSKMERRGMLPSSFFGRPGEARRSS